VLASEPIRAQKLIRFGEDCELDVNVRRLSRAGHLLRLERIPLEILVLLLEHHGEIVSRDEIVERVWGKGVFLDTDNGIRGAIRKIRHVLKDQTEHPRFIQTVTGQGYRFIAPVMGAEEDRGLSIASRSMPNDRHVARTPQARRWFVLGGVAVLALLAATYLVNRRRAGDATQAKIRSLAVLPLKNLSGDPAQEYLADGMTEAVIGRLSVLRGLRVISRTSAMRFKDTRMSAPEIATTLHVDAIVEGSVMRAGDRVRVNVQLIRSETDNHLWSEAYDREMQDVLALQSEVAHAIARRVEVTLTGEEHARLVAARNVAPEVYESYLKGWFAKRNNRTEVKESIAYFEEAISKDATFAPAYVGLAAAYDRLGDVIVAAPPGEVTPKVVSAAQKALELDPGLAEPHALLAYMYQKHWQWADAEAEYKRALDLNPNDVSAHLGFATWLVCQGRTEEALAWSRRARELDPLGVTGLSNGWILFHSRRYNEAIRELRSVRAVHPDFATVHWFLGMTLIANGQSEEAIPVLEKAVSLTRGSPAVVGTLIRAQAHAGRRTEALRLVGDLKRRQQTTYVPANALVDAYLGLGDRDQAFAWLDRAFDEQANTLQYLRVHPDLDPLRGDPRFTNLLRRVGLDRPR
jgi:TolB-like protein/DNA-binding winged helix-turn-helix (wHTH) protein/Tfp pilus assembly protein PilF